MKIGNVNLANPYILAPMAGVTDCSVKSREPDFCAWR